MARSSSSFGDIRVSPRNQRLLKWLRRKPLPHTVVGECEDGEERRAVVNASGPATWSDVLSVVRACVHLEARDADGNTLRAIDLDPDDPELRAETELERAEQQIARSHPGSVPIISVDIPRLIDNLGRNMREVASEAARQQAGAHKEGFNAMVSVVNLCLGLLVRLEARMASYEERAELERDNATPPPALPQRDQLAILALQRALGGGASAPSSNGAGGFDLGALMRIAQQFQPQPPTEGGEQ